MTGISTTELSLSDSGSFAVVDVDSNPAMDHIDWIAKLFVIFIIITYQMIHTVGQIQ
jgi:hypothetical protein